MNKKFDAGKINFNALLLIDFGQPGNTERTVNEIKNSDYSPSQNDLFIAYALASLNNGVVTPVTTLTKVENAEIETFGIFCEGNFIEITEDAFKNYNLDINDYGVKRYHSEFNDNLSVDSIKEFTYSPELSDRPIKMEQIRKAFNSVIDLRFCFRMSSSPNKIFEYYNTEIVHTEKAYLTKDLLFYLSPCTVEFKSGVKTIAYCITNFSRNIATPYIYLDRSLSPENLALEQSISKIKPIVTFNQPDGTVKVLEGDPLVPLSYEFFTLLRDLKSKHATS